MFQKLSRNLTAERDAERRMDLFRKLLRHEARVGGTLFGPVPEGRYREFFCLDEHTWVWHEEWTTPEGVHKYVTTRYDVRPNGILKSQNGTYVPITPEEVRKLVKAVRLYDQRMKQELYAAVAV